MNRGEGRREGEVGCGSCCGPYSVLSPERASEWADGGVEGAPRGGSRELGAGFVVGGVAWGNWEMDVDVDVDVSREESTA